MTTVAVPDVVTRARGFVEDVLIPLEEKSERARGQLPAEDVDRIRAAALDAGLAGGLHAREHGGQGWTKTEWVLVEEQYGRSTNALSWHIPSAYNVLASGSPEQIERYLKPALRGELHDAYAVTEANAGSDPSKIETRAERRDGGWVINGEKWFVTYGDVAAVYIVVAMTDSGPTLFLVDRSCDGVEIVDDPPFTHTYPHGHPTIRFTNVVVSDADIVGGVGEGTTCSARGSPRSGSGSPRVVSARCGGCSTRPWRGRPGASRAARGSTTTRACRSRWPIRRRTPRPGAR
jgi:acyl-CoA dehydrogenase